jgi:hypothetical protein
MDERWFEVAGFWKRTQSRKAAKKMRYCRMRGGSKSQAFGNARKAAEPQRRCVPCRMRGGSKAQAFGNARKAAEPQRRCVPCRSFGFIAAQTTIPQVPCSLRARSEASGRGAASGRVAISSSTLLSLIPLPVRVPYELALLYAPRKLAAAAQVDLSVLPVSNRRIADPAG